MVNQVLIRAIAAALMLVSTGCGRIAMTAPGPTRAALLSPNSAMPSDLRSAEHAARDAAGMATDAPMVYCALGVFDKQGRQRDNNEATVLARFARPGGNRPALRTVYMDFQGKARTFWGPVDTNTVYGMHVTFPEAWLASPADAVPLDVTKLPSPRTAIAWALASGLPGSEFFVMYASSRAGAVVSIGQWERGGDVTQIGAVATFDAVGHKLAASNEADVPAQAGPKDAAAAPDRSAPAVLPPP
ncbi:MAG: hypothetical protein JWM80_895 [Cyanobacteria bacterium RYN_339]|nr:hypothetical protein [Cyanobacteria bacterium RYN_339]